jgi:capsule polysaccharide export protein KpsE/RkpR
MKLFANRDWTIIFWTYFSIAMILVAISYGLKAYTEQGRITRAVYSVCNSSRLVTNGQLEQACGNAQSVSDTEFICDHNNQDPSTHCWVELK